MSMNRITWMLLAGVCMDEWRNPRAESNLERQPPETPQANRTGSNFDPSFWPTSHGSSRNVGYSRGLEAA
ncbi:hypothetical protein POX_h09513 [Penicillium oxalicum]|uniref:hypothetical protein n=1 Tax=Penicillium oxalicum TaxID=69781 RepID=UPI0020B6F200|nr:hypothetical protein POX_h09513 [Penicillium oxalicum]KAI2785754.1 hypothetical protein POX_h09513 [Penicillium oxalicum]